MKKNLISMLLIVALIVTMAVPAFADTDDETFLNDGTRPPTNSEETLLLNHGWEVLSIEDAFEQGWGIFSNLGIDNIADIDKLYDVIQSGGTSQVLFDRDVVLNQTFANLAFTTGPSLGHTAFIYVVNFAQSPGPIEARLLIGGWMPDWPITIPRGDIGRRPIFHGEWVHVQARSVAFPHSVHRVRIVRYEPRYIRSEFEYCEFKTY